MLRRIAKYRLFVVVGMCAAFWAGSVRAGEIDLTLKDLTGNPLPDDVIVTFQDSAGQPLTVTRTDLTTGPVFSNRFRVRNQLTVSVDPNTLVQPIPGRIGQIDKTVFIRFARAVNEFQITNSLSAIVGNSENKDEVQKIHVAVPEARCQRCPANCRRSWLRFRR
jgi:hypothetical protein